VPSRAGARGPWRSLLGYLIAGSMLLGAGCAAPAPAGPGAGATGASPAGAAASVPAGSQATAAPLRPTAPEVVKVAASVSVSGTGFFIGLERGYFREQGIEVEIVPFEGAK
jgi:ABC-type nitrate/sulfonate/bicarbonate transport system substrate-binding protein